jgi:beta-lactam-binding protein with PASTA domain
VVKCVVPRVVGRSLARAKASIRSHHCTVGQVTRKFSTLKKKGKVLAQAPKAGKRLKRGAKVNLIVGKGPKRGTGS